MRIAIIGTGNVGGALGVGWARRGHPVVFGSRNPRSERTRQVVVDGGPGTSAAAPDAAAAEADVIVLATPWAATEGVARSLGDVGDKIVVDCTNPLAPDLTGLALDSGSGGERVASWLTGGRVVKAFNTTGAANMADSDYGGPRLWMPICGDDPAAKATVAELAHELGFEAVDSGGLERAEQLEQLAVLWISLVFQQGLGPGIGLVLARRDAG